MKAYNDFYEAISNPHNSKHNMVLPFGAETLSFTAYVTQGEDNLRIRKGKNEWGYDGLTINFIAMEPQRRR